MRAAQRLQVLVGERLEVESPHPRAQVTGVARADRRPRLESVEAAGKNLLLRFEGGVVVRSHLRMTGRWRVERARARRAAAPVARAARPRARGSALERPGARARDGGRCARLGPDVLADDVRPRRGCGRTLRGAGDRWLGEALQDQRLVAGIGNMWMAEALWEARGLALDRVRDVRDETLGAAARRRPAG